MRLQHDVVEREQCVRHLRLPGEDVEAGGPQPAVHEGIDEGVPGHYGNPIVRAIYQPGLWLQSLTTRPPDREMLEVSIASLESCIASDREAAAAASA